MIKENSDKIAAFKNNSDYSLVKTGQNAFENVNHVKSFSSSSRSDIFSYDESDEEAQAIESDDDNDKHYDM